MVMHRYLSQARIIPVLLTLAFLLAGCASEEHQWYTLEGKTMGTTYRIQYFGLSDLQKEIDELLAEINQSVSTYIPESAISRFNQSGSLEIPLADNGDPKDILHTHFFANLQEAYEVYKASDGYFDPTVGPLVEAWGFGSAGRQDSPVDSATIDSLRRLVGMEHVTIATSPTAYHVRLAQPGMRLDFSALAKGYGVDRVHELIQMAGATDIFVEIGGEVRVSGASPRGDAWLLGINAPSEDAGLTDIAVRIRLREGGMATSGNYRNFYLRDGRKVWHTMNPKTGYPEENNLLSATVVHRTCMTADALATACMAMGIDRAIDMIRTIPGAEAYFIYMGLDGKVATFVTAGLEKDVIEE